MLWKANIILSLCSLGAFYSTDISGATLWIAGFVGYLIPFLLLSNVLFLVFWLTRKPVRSLLPIITLLFGFRFITGSIGLHLPEKKEGNEHAFEVLSYNVRVFNRYDHLRDDDYQSSLAMIDWIKNNPAAIVCLQEYYNMDTDDVYNATNTISEKFPFHMVSPCHVNRLGGEFGMAIFSKYPIVSTGELLFDFSPQNYVIYADIRMPTDTIRVYNAHLLSMKIEDDMLAQEAIQKDPKPLARRLKNGFIWRSKQADTLYNHISACPHSVILCGDINDLPYSYTYQQLRKKMHNAFEQKGRGFGFTHNGKIPFLRIDHQFFTPGIRILHFETHRGIQWSDHFPITATYELKP